MLIGALSYDMTSLWEYMGYMFTTENICYDVQIEKYTCLEMPYVALCRLTALLESRMKMAGCLDGFSFQI